MEIVNPLSPSGAKEDIKTVLYALAGQGGRDGEPYDQMQVAGDYIATLEAELERWEQSRDGVLSQLEEIECRNMTLEVENKRLKELLESETFYLKAAQREIARLKEDVAFLNHVVDEGKILNDELLAEKGRWRDDRQRKNLP